MNFFKKLFGRQKEEKYKNKKENHEIQGLDYNNEMKQDAQETGTNINKENDIEESNIEESNTEKSDTEKNSIENSDVEKDSTETISEKPCEETEHRGKEWKSLMEFSENYKNLLSQNTYLAYRDYRCLIETYRETMEYFGVIQKSDLLEEYCIKKGIQNQFEVKEILESYQKIEERIKNHNESYIVDQMKKEKDYLDNILKEVNPEISLDEDQRRVVLTDEDHCLVIAGAGAGKTTTVAAKVRYLVEKKKIKPEQILVISFTNRAVDELKEKIQKDLHIQCPITTFHATGNAILRQHSEEPLRIIDSSRLYFIILNFFRTSILSDESMVKNLLLFFASYFDVPINEKDPEAFFRNISKANYATLKSDLNEYQKTILDKKTRKRITIQDEVMRSYEEVEIANFLYLNQLDYEYESIYPYRIEGAGKPYTPDFIIKQGDKTIYLEHFGITEDGKSDRFGTEELYRYQKAIQDKRKIHTEHNTKMLETYSVFGDGRSIEEHLKEQLLREGFVLNPRPAQEVVEKIVASEENRYVRKLINLICRFITNFKTNGYTEQDFSNMYQRANNERSKLFLQICRGCYLEYQKYLTEQKAVDFEDMINESARILREAEASEQKLDFKYIIVDEYQDISRQRFDLTSALSKVCNAKIMAVGDDWQSIYAFSGSDIELFTKFTEKMGSGCMLKIVKTYRNSQEVIDIAGNFIQKNDTQIKKALKASKNIQDPVIIYTYDASRKRGYGDTQSGANYALAKGIETALEQIMEYNRQEGKKEEEGKILLLGRFGFDGHQLERTGLFEYQRRESKIRSVKYPKMKITFLTAHASKGLGYDNVILINGKNETYGFPAKIEDDPVLSFVVKEDHSMDYAEERRLFYVAMTRTKNRVYCIAPEQNPSEFLLEIKKEYKNVVLKGEWNEEPPIRQTAKMICPVCGYPLQLRYKESYGLRMYICTNEPEVCGFLSNDLRGKKMSIVKCNKCKDGYLIVRMGQGGAFLGCTNFKEDRTGCGNTISQKEYYRKFGWKMEKSQEESLETPPTCQNHVPSKERECDKKQITDNKAGKSPVLVREQKKVEMIEEGDTYYVYDFFVRGHSIFELLSDILNGVESISRIHYYGTLVTIDVLRGINNAKVKKGKLNELPVFAVLSDMDKETLECIIEWMISHHFLFKMNGRYPVLHPTYEGRHFKEFVKPEQLKELRNMLAETKEGDIYHKK